MIHMASDIKKNKKILSKKMAREKGFEIPVYMVKNDVRPPVAPSAKSEPAGIQARKNRTSGFKIVKDENDLPVFEKIAENDLLSMPFGLSEDVDREEKNDDGIETGQILEDQRETKIRDRAREGNWGKKILLMPLGKRKMIMWVGVFAAVSLVFFIWFSVFKNNFSFNFGSSNPFVWEKGENDSFNGLGDSLDDLRSQWAEVRDLLEEKAANAANQEVVNKLKEKVLVEEMKNKLNTE